MGTFTTPTTNTNAQLQNKKLGQNAPQQLSHVSRLNPMHTGQQLQSQFDEQHENPVQQPVSQPNPMGDYGIKPFSLAPNLLNTQLQQQTP